jgi:NAD(P)-dependent dehydrogenase (short-subunit alcohol dehydrogenase family)
MTSKTTQVAVITGASQGLGRALAQELASRGWSLVLDARQEAALAEAVRQLPGGPHPAIAGDVTDPAHRRELVEVAAELGGATALVNNASTLGASPLPRLAQLDTETYLRILEVNLVAPVALTAALLPQLRAGDGVVLNLTSDASVEPYETWGGYGSSKAGLDHATRVLAAEEPELRVYAVDPGDMRTQLHQDAFPGEDISDRPEPTVAVPGLLRLLDGSLPSGRYRAVELAPVGAPA